MDFVLQSRSFPQDSPAGTGDQRPERSRPHHVRSPARPGPGPAHRISLRVKSPTRSSCSSSGMRSSRRCSTRSAMAAGLRRARPGTARHGPAQPGPAPAASARCPRRFRGRCALCRPLPGWRGQNRRVCTGSMGWKGSPEIAQFNPPCPTCSRGHAGGFEMSPKRETPRSP